MATHDSEQLGEWLSAYADGELDAVEVQRVEALLRESAEARRMLEEFRRTAGLVAALPRHDAPPSILEELRLHAEREELLGGLDPLPAVRSGWRGWVMGILSTAAVLTIVVGGGWYLTVGGGAVPARERSVVASVPRAEGEKLEPTDRARPSAKRKRSSARPRLSTERREGATTATPSATAPPLAHGQPGGTADTLLAEATMEQKLRAGLDVETVRDHAFANETVQLQIEVASEPERDRVIARLATYLSGRRVVDVSGSRNRASSASPHRFFYAGAPSKNFPGANDREILVRATNSDLHGLVAKAAAATGREDDIVLVSGPLKIHGANQVQRTLNGLAPSPGAIARHPSNEAVAAELRDTEGFASRLDERKLSAAPDEFIASLIDMLGLDDSVTSASAEAVATKPTSAAGASPDSGRKTHPAPAEEAPASTVKPTGNERALTTSSGRQSLVSRRADALRKSAERPSLGTNAPGPKRSASRHARGRKQPTSPEAATTVERAAAEEPVVTLVVSVKIVKPADRRRNSPVKPRTSRRPPAKIVKPKGKSDHRS